METKRQEAIRVYLEGRAAMLKLTGSAFIAGEKCAKGDGEKCRQLALEALHSFSYAISLLGMPDKIAYSDCNDTTQKEQP